MLNETKDTNMLKRTMQPIEYDVLERMTLSAYSNMVLIKVPDFKEERTTRGGIILDINPDIQYFSDNDESSHMADLERVVGVVEKVPPGLLPDGDMLAHFTDMELQVGDTVYFDYHDSINSISFVCGSDEFRAIPYSSIYLAIRGEELYPINGYVLFLEVYKEDLESGKAKIDKDGGPEIMTSLGPNLDPLKGKVFAMGKPVEYWSDYYTDDIEVAVGDIVEFRKKAPRVFLERQKYLQTLPERIFRHQRRDIIFNHSK